MYTSPSDKDHNGNSIASLATFLSGLQADPTQLNQVRSFFGYLRAGSRISPSRLAWYETLFELAPQAYLVTDQNGIVRDANATAVEVFGIDRQSLIGLDLCMFLPNEQLTFRLFPEQETAPAARVSKVELELVPLNKSRFHLHGWVAQAYDPQASNMVFLWLFDSNQLGGDEFREELDAVPLVKRTDSGIEGDGRVSEGIGAREESDERVMEGAEPVWRAFSKVLAGR